MARKDKYIGAVLTLKDQFTSKLKGVKKEQRDFRKDLQSTKKALEDTYKRPYKLDVNYSNIEKAGKSIRNFTKSASSNIRETANTLKVLGRMSVRPVISIRDQATGTISRIRSSLLSVQGIALGVVGTVGGAYAGKSVFDRTIGASASMELNQEQIKAMFRNDPLAHSYMKMLDQFAVDSPILNSKDMYTNSKSFISTFKDTKNLEKSWKLAEKMAAFDPIQGVEGAVFALKELFSGDAVSMVERFEMPRKELNEIKKLKPEKQLNALEKLFTKMGFTDEFITKSAATAVGQWNQINEKIAKGMQLMGVKGLQNIKPELVKFNKWLEGEAAQGIRDFGSDMIGGLTQSAIDGFYKVKKYIDSHFLNNDRFKNLDVKSKVEFVIQDIYQSFKGWYSGGGSDQIKSMGSDVVTTLADAIKMSAKPIADAGLSIGKEIASGIWTGLKEAFDNNPVMGFIFSGVAAMAVPGGPAAKATAFGALVGQTVVNPALENREKAILEEEKKRAEARDKILNSKGTKDKPVFGGEASFISPSDHKIQVRKEIGKNARGTQYWRGGLTMVGEEGPELMQLPSGTKIHSAQESKQMVSHAGNDIQINIYAHNKSLSEILSELVPKLKQVLANM